MEKIVQGTLNIVRYKQATDKDFLYSQNEVAPTLCSLEITGEYRIDMETQEFFTMMDLELHTNFTNESIGKAIGFDPEMRFINFSKEWGYFRSFVYRVERFPTNFSPKAIVDFKYQDTRNDHIHTGHHEVVLGKYVHWPKGNFPLGISRSDTKEW
jgi:hypothetical protein